MYEYVKSKIYLWLTPLCVPLQNQQIIWLPTEDGSYALHEAIVVPSERPPANTTGPCLLLDDIYIPFKNTHKTHIYNLPPHNKQGVHHHHLHQHPPPTARRTGPCRTSGSPSCCASRPSWRGASTRGVFACRSVVNRFVCLFRFVCVD